MKLIPLRTALLVLLLGNGLFAVENESKPSEAAKTKQATEAEIMARLAEHAQEKALGPEAKTDAKDPVPAAKAGDAEPEEPVTMMQEITVSSSRISELDIQIKKLEKQIKRAQKKLKPSSLDETLNSDKTPKALLIFGGKTAAQRQSVAAERLNLMEAERDILEAMKHVRTKKEEQQLETQLNAFKTMRRELDETLR